MSESGSSDQDTTEEIDDPGRDPEGLDPPRNLFGGGPTQDSGRGEPKGTADSEGEPEPEPESPTEDDDTPDGRTGVRRRATPRRATRPRRSRPGR